MNGASLEDVHRDQVPLDLIYMVIYQSQILTSRVVITRYLNLVGEVGVGGVEKSAKLEVSSGDLLSNKMTIVNVHFRITKGVMCS